MAKIARRRRKAALNAIQGTLFSDAEMEQMLVLRPVVAPDGVSIQVLPSYDDLTEAQQWEIAVRANLESDGCTDPDVLESFLCWWGMAAGNSS